MPCNIFQGHNRIHRNNFVIVLERQSLPCPLTTSLRKAVDDLQTKICVLGKPQQTAIEDL